jgi:isoleucyl-tRNA synthetase
VPASAGWGKVLELRGAALQVLEKAKATMATRTTSVNPKTGQAEERVSFDTLDFGLALPGEAIAGFDPADLADLMGVSRVEGRAVAGPELLDLRGDPQCQRSWKRDGTVRRRSDGGLLSDRDAAAVGVV